MEERGNTRGELEYWKAKAAVDWVRGSYVEAREAWGHASDLAQKLPSVGAYMRDREEVAEIGRLLNEVATTSGTTLLAGNSTPQPQLILAPNPALAQS